MEDWPEHVNIFCQIFGGFPLTCAIGPDGKKQFCSSLTSKLWSVTLVSLQFFASMLWASKWYDRYTIDSFFYDEHKVFKGIMLARAIANTTMILVLFFSYNRKQLRFARIHYDLDMIDRNLRLTTKCANATMKIVATCIVYGVALPSISTLLWMIHFHNKNFSFQEQKSSIIHYVCISSMAWAQGVVLFHFNHITQGIAARFLNVTYKIEQVVVGNDSTSLMPYQILVSGSSLEKTIPIFFFELGRKLRQTPPKE
ncbi:hypothetical protein J6590_081245 [Homalodisca vitripennis]|nr:hypothetical protein J6590_081245 [Homalodisca vitripennis]